MIFLTLFQFVFFLLTLYFFSLSLFLIRNQTNLFYIYHLLITFINEWKKRDALLHILLSSNLIEIKAFDILIYFIKFLKNLAKFIKLPYYFNYIFAEIHGYSIEKGKIWKIKKKYLFKKNINTVFHSTKDKRFPFAISIRTFDPLVRFAKLLRCARVCF